MAKVNKITQDINLNEYSKVYARKNKEWIITGYSCRKCLSKFATFGRLQNHPEVCKGQPTPATRHSYGKAE